MPSDAQLADAAGALPLGLMVWQVRPAGGPLRCVAANDAAVRLLATRTDLLVGRDWREVFAGAHTDSPQASEAAWTRVAREGVPLPRTEVTGWLGGGSPQVFALHVVPLPGERVAVLFEDVTERHAADRHRLDLLGRVVTAPEEERQRLAERLHEGHVQELTAVALRLALLRRQLAGMPERHDLLEAEAAMRRAADGLRDVLFDLSPPALDTAGLPEALRQLAERVFNGTSIQVEIVDRRRAPTDLRRRLVAYRVLQEALTNARVHAHARHVSVVLGDRDAGLLAVLTDDGCGIGRQRAESQPTHQPGLRSMQERAEALGGTCRVDRVPQGGTTVELWLPAPDEEAATTGR